MSLNRATIMGRLTATPELRHTGSGTAVTSFSLAVDRDFKGQNGEKETDFFDVVCWRTTAEFVCRNLAKGRQIVVDGRLQTRAWEKDGQKHRSVELVADSVYFADSKSEGKTQAQNMDALSGRMSGFAEVEDDGPLPF